MSTTIPGYGLWLLAAINAAFFIVRVDEEWKLALVALAEDLS